MTAAVFGASAGLLQRLRPARIPVADLRDAAETLLPALCGPDLRVRLVRSAGAGSAVVVEEHERRMRIPLSELADDMTAAGVAPTTEGISDALSAWVAHRPVSDAAAAGAGIGVLDWSDARRTAVGWQVVVRRDGLTLPWTPSDPLDAAALHRTRAAAAARALDAEVDLRVEGPVALWSHPSAPALATTVLVDPEGMIARARSAGLAMSDMHVVITPRRPVACARPGVAARLAGESTEPSVTLPWRRLADLPWL